MRGPVLPSGSSVTLPVHRGPRHHPDRSHPGAEDADHRPVIAGAEAARGSGSDRSTRATFPCSAWLVADEGLGTGHRARHRAAARKLPGFIAERPHRVIGLLTLPARRRHARIVTLNALSAGSASAPCSSRPRPARRGTSAAATSGSPPPTITSTRSASTSATGSGSPSCGRARSIAPGRRSPRSRGSATTASAARRDRPHAAVGTGPTQGPRPPRVHAGSTPVKPR